MLTFYNTLTRSQEEFSPLEGNTVRMYTCGPTVYNHAHIGNYRAYVFEDLLHRYLKFRGFELKHVMNLTDVDDKIIAKAAAENVSIEDVTAPFIKSFFKNLDDLNIERADVYPRATEHIDEMVNIVQALIERGLAYEKDGSYYFDISKFPNYGKLVHIDPENLKAGARGESDEYDKDNARDFALWKDMKPGEHAWETDLGKGRPGWHIECSAMAMKHLGKSLDIHCGGVDNIFPHHENEIAQSEGATGEPFVRYWLHCEHLIVDGQKMSKSLGNQYTLQELQDKGYDVRAIRYLLMSTHYRRRVNFTFDGLAAATSSLRRIDEFILRLQEGPWPEGSSDEGKAAVSQCREEFIAGLDDDLNISPALAAIYNIVKMLNTMADEGQLKADDAEAALSLLKELDQVLGVMTFEEETLDDNEIKRLIEARTEARAQRNFAEADRIRDELVEKGIVLQDSPAGTKWRRA